MTSQVQRSGVPDAPSFLGELDSLRMAVLPEHSKVLLDGLFGSKRARFASVAGEGSAADGLAGDDAEEDLDHVQQ
jgi:hypothetical protein